MAATGTRMLRLLGLLQTHRFWAGPELADRLGVSPRTVRRDVDRLRELGYPVAAHPGIDGGYQLAAGTALPPLVLDDDEAVALAIGLRLAAEGSVTGIEESSVRALAKLSQVMPPTLRRRIDALRTTMFRAGPSSSPTVDAAMLTLLAQACRDEERVRFVYTASSGDDTSRHVEPHTLVSLGRRWYLVAFDLVRNDWRTFRLDRIATARSTGARFAPRKLPTPDAATFVRRSLDNLPRQYAVEVVINAPAGVARGRLGDWARIEKVDEARCRMRMTVDNLDWPLLALGSLRADFAVVQPPELIEQAREWAARFSRATSSS